MHTAATAPQAIDNRQLLLAIKRLTSDTRTKTKNKQPKIRVDFRKKAALDPAAQHTVTVTAPSGKPKSINLPGYLMINYYFYDNTQHKVKEACLYTLGAVFNQQQAQYLWEQAHIIVAKEVQPVLDAYVNDSLAMFDGYDDFFPVVREDGRVHYCRLADQPAAFHPSRQQECKSLPVDDVQPVICGLENYVLTKPAAAADVPDAIAGKSTGYQSTFEVLQDKVKSIDALRHHTDGDTVQLYNQHIPADALTLKNANHFAVLELFARMWKKCGFDQIPAGNKLFPVVLAHVVKHNVPIVLLKQWMQQNFSGHVPLFNEKTIRKAIHEAGNVQVAEQISYQLRRYLASCGKLDLLNFLLVDGTSITVEARDHQHTNIKLIFRQLYRYAFQFGQAISACGHDSCRLKQQLVCLPEKVADEARQIADDVVRFYRSNKWRGFVYYPEKPGLVLAYRKAYELGFALKTVAGVVYDKLKVAGCTLACKVGCLLEQLNNYLVELSDNQLTTIRRERRKQPLTFEATGLDKQVIRFTFGHEKQRRNMPIYQVMNVCAADGFPCVCYSFDGNDSEKRTVPAIVARFAAQREHVADQDKYLYPDPIIVADSAHANPYVYRQLAQAGVRFVFASKQYSQLVDFLHQGFAEQLRDWQASLPSEAELLGCGADGAKVAELLRKIRPPFADGFRCELSENDPHAGVLRSVWEFSHKDFTDQLVELPRAVICALAQHGKKDRKSASSLCRLESSKSMVSFCYDRFVNRLLRLGWTGTVTNTEAKEMDGDRLISTRRMLYQVERSFYVEKSIFSLADAGSNIPSWRRGCTQVALMAYAIRLAMEHECGDVLTADQIVSLLWPFVSYSTLQGKLAYVAVTDERCLRLFLHQGLGWAYKLDPLVRAGVVLKPDYHRTGAGKGAGTVTR